MMEEERSTLEDLSATQIIEGVLGDLESEGLKLIITPPKVIEDEEVNKIAAEEVPQDGGHEDINMRSQRGGNSMYTLDFVNVDLQGQGEQQTDFKLLMPTRRTTCCWEDPGLSPQGCSLYLPSVFNGNLEGKESPYQCYNISFPKR